MTTSIIHPLTSCISRLFIACDSEVTVTFSFGSRVWVIGPQDFELLHVRNDTCVSAFFRLTAGGTTPKWIIGDTFLVSNQPVVHFYDDLFKLLSISAYNRKTFIRCFSMNPQQ